MQSPIPFSFQETPIRVVMRDNDPWFVAKDVCDVLGHSNPSQAIVDAELDDDEKGISSADTLGGTQDMLIVSESGIYGLVQTSRKPEAKAFRRWLRREVLPEIRRTGAYRVQRLIEWQRRMVEQFVSQQVRTKIEPKLRSEYHYKLVRVVVSVCPMDGSNDVPHEFAIEPANRYQMRLPDDDGSD